MTQQKEIIENRLSLKLLKTLLLTKGVPTSTTKSSEACGRSFYARSKNCDPPPQARKKNGAFNYTASMVDAGMLLYCSSDGCMRAGAIPGRCYTASVQSVLDEPPSCVVVVPTGQAVQAEEPVLSANQP